MKWKRSEDGSNSLKSHPGTRSEPGLALLLSFAPGSIGMAAAPDLSITISPEAVRRLVQAAVPYTLQLDAGLFEQVVILDEPRNLRFFDGGIRMEVTATGSPVGFTAELEPVVHLERAAGSSSYQVRIGSLPVRMGLVGTVDLATAIPPIPVKQLSDFLLESDGKSIPMQLEIQDIKVSEAGIAVGLKTRHAGEFLSAGP